MSVCDCDGCDTHSGCDVCGELTKLNVMMEQMLKEQRQQTEYMKDIDKVVRLGNGKPPLTERVALLEDNVKENRTVIAKLFAVWGTITTTVMTAVSAYLGGS
jgi:hypothetical protein